MPTRVVRGEILNSRSLARVSLGAELFFRNLIALVDDYGRYDGDPEILAAHAYPRRREVTAKHVAGWLAELVNADGEGCGPVITYASGGRPYLALVNWETHRGRSRRGAASRWPAPAELGRNAAPGVASTASAEIRGNPRGSSDLHALPRGSARGVEESRSRGVEESGKDTKSASGASRVRSRISLETPCPAELDLDAQARVRAWAFDRGITADQLDYAWQAVRDWAVSKRKRYADWEATFRNQLRKGWPLDGFGTAPGVERESPAQARERRTIEAARRVIERGPVDPFRLALVAGSEVPK